MAVTVWEGTVKLQNPAGHALRVAYSSAVYTGLQTDSGGDLTIAPTGDGVLIDQGAADGNVFSLKSSDVAHGITDRAPTSVYGYLRKNNATNGGVVLEGLSESDVGVVAFGSVTSANTTRGTTAKGAVTVGGALKSGTGLADIGADGNLLVVRNQNTARFLVDAEGDVHYDGTTNATAWDEHDDVALLSTLRALTTDRETAKRYFAEFIGDERRIDILHRSGVITRNPNGHHFVSTKGLNGLLIDAVRQLAGRLERLEASP